MGARGGLLVAALFLVGCGGGAPDGAVVRDSAGVRIVENPAPAERVAFEVSPEPILAIGTLDGPPEYTFRGVRDADRLPGGGVVVADGAELRFYDAEGRHVRTVGGEGEGPGEFSFLMGVVRCGGELYAGDMRQQHLTVYDLAGELLRTDPLPASGHMFLSLELAACDEATGRPLLRAPRPFTPPGQEPEPDTVADILRLAAEGGAVDTVARLPRRPTPQGARSPFTARTEFAFGPDATHVVYTADMAVRSYGPEGGLLRIARVEHTPRPVTREDNQRAIDSLLAAMPGGFPDQIRDRLERATPPDNMPAVSSVRADAAGRVWLRPYRTPWDEPVTDWLVLAPDGTLAGTVRLPPRFRPTEIGEDWVLGVARDEMDVTYVRLHGLTEIGGGGALTAHTEVRRNGGTED